MLRDGIDRKRKEMESNKKRIRRIKLEALCVREREGIKVTIKEGWVKKYRALPVVLTSLMTKLGDSGLLVVDDLG